MALGTILYVALLLTNAIAVLSEERFLAKGEWRLGTTLRARELCFLRRPTKRNRNTAHDGKARIRRSGCKGAGVEPAAEGARRDMTLASVSWKRLVAAAHLAKDHTVTAYSDACGAPWPMSRRSAPNRHAYLGLLLAPMRIFGPSLLTSGSSRISPCSVTIAFTAAAAVVLRFCRHCYPETMMTFMLR